MILITQDKNAVVLWFDTTILIHQTSNVNHTLVGNKIADHSDVDGASPVSAAPTTSSLLT